MTPLTHPQWKAAQDCARILATCSPNRSEDRAAYREARDRLAAMLPPGTDTRPIITRALRFDMADSIALCELELERV